MAKCYVSMTDKVLSGWGNTFGKINKIVLECDSYDEALIVEQNAMDRSEMKYINICMNNPRYDSRRYYVSRHDKTDYATWYEKTRPFRR